MDSPWGNVALQAVCTLKRRFTLAPTTGGRVAPDVVFEIVVSTNASDKNLRRKMRQQWHDFAAQWEAECSGRIPSVLELANTLSRETAHDLKQTEAWHQMDPKVREASLQLWLAQVRLAFHFLPGMRPEYVQVREALQLVLQRICNLAQGSNFRRLKGLRDGYQTDWDTLVLESERALNTALQAASTHQNGVIRTGYDDRLSSQTKLNLPRLLKLQAQDRRVILFGGDRRPKKLELVRAMTDLTPEWLGAGHKVRLGQAVIKSIQSQSVVGVLILEGLIGHSHAGSKEIVNACKRFSVPFALAGTGGIGQLLQALEQIEAAHSASQ